MSKPVNATDATFQNEVSDGDKAVLVDFWAPWCGPCRIVGPVLEEIASEEADRVKIVKVNVDENQQYASQLGVFNIPTMIVYKNGQPVDKIVGAMPKAQIMERLKPHMS
jgi:thioredoxin 1